MTLYFDGEFTEEPDDPPMSDMSPVEQANFTISRYLHRKDITPVTGDDLLKLAQTIRNTLVFGDRLQESTLLDLAGQCIAWEAQRDTDNDEG